MSLLDAVHEDMNGDFGGAATCYEQAIQAGNAPFEAYLNLAVLYWQCTDYGFNATHMLSSHAKEIRYFVPTCARISLTLWQSVSKFR